MSHFEAGQVVRCITPDVDHKFTKGNLYTIADPCSGSSLVRLKEVKGMWDEKRFVPVDVKSFKPGDVVVLDPATPENHGCGLAFNKFYTVVTDDGHTVEIEGEVGAWFQNRFVHADPLLVAIYRELSRQL